jgi:hypothetical protein
MPVVPPASRQLIINAVVDAVTTVTCCGGSSTSTRSKRYYTTLACPFAPLVLHSAQLLQLKIRQHHDQQLCGHKSRDSLIPLVAFFHLMLNFMLSLLHDK